MIKVHTGCFIFHNPIIVAAVSISTYKNSYQNLNCTKYLTLCRTGTYGNYIYCKILFLHKTVEYDEMRTIYNEHFR